MSPFCVRPFAVPGRRRSQASIATAATCLASSPGCTSCPRGSLEVHVDDVLATTTAWCCSCASRPSSTPMRPTSWWPASTTTEVRTTGAGRRSSSTTSLASIASSQEREPCRRRRHWLRHAWQRGSGGGHADGRSSDDHGLLPPGAVQDAPGSATDTTYAPQLPGHRCSTSMARPRSGSAFVGVAGSHARRVFGVWRSRRRAQGETRGRRP